MKCLFAAFISLSGISYCYAQDPDTDNENVRLLEVKREFSFVQGNAEHPVLIKELTEYRYQCRNYRTKVPVAEFYNDMETIDDIQILVDGSKKHGIVPAHDFYEADGIFYSDARICHFSLPLAEKESISSVKIKKTILDPKYFTSVHFMEPFPVQSQELIIRVPSWMKLELKDFNFGNYSIQKKVAPDGGETVYRYTAENLPALKRESASPGFTYYSPHVMVMCKTADTKQGKQTYFNTLQDQYNWYRKLIADIGNDIAPVKARAVELTRDAQSEEEKVKLVFQWVQDNIRYIAFEDGIAGFKPEKAQEVLRKKYGDCKGMANLMVEMLRALGLDARRCWIGTRHIAYDYSTPSLAVDNHMIAVWMKNNKPVYLDATEKYIGFGEIAERIQGRQTLIEDGAKFILGHVPGTTARQNTAFEKRKLVMEGSHLKGHVAQSWKGENKVMLLSGLNSIRSEKQELALSRYLAEGKNNVEISGLRIANLTDYNKDLIVEYDMTWKNALAEFGEEVYVEVDNRRNFESFKIDPAKRKLPYWFDFKNHLVLETELQLPDGKEAGSLPTALKIERPGYLFSGTYAVKGKSLHYRCEIEFRDTELRPVDFEQWNKDVDELKEFYNQQIVLTTKK